MTIEFHCPNCRKLLRTADDKAGVSARCPGCGEMVTVPAAPEPSPASGASGADALAEMEAGDDEAIPVEAIEDDDSAGAGPGVALTEAESKTCPMCGARIRRAATRCRFCGEDLATQEGFDAGRVLSRTWELFQSHMGVCMLAGGTFVLYLIGATAVSYALQIYMDVIVGPDPVLHGIVLVVFNVGSNLLQLFLLLGICRVMLRVARGEPVTIGDALSGGRYLVRAFLASIIFNVGMLLIAAVFVGPGVFLIVAGGPRPVPLIVLCLGAIAAFVVTVWLWLMFFFNLYCLVDRDAGAIESLRQARELSSGNMLHLLVLVLAWLGLSVAGYCMCLFGLFFTVPLMFLSQAVAYVAMRERR